MFSVPQMQSYDEDVSFGEEYPELIYLCIVFSLVFCDSLICSILNFLWWEIATVFICEYKDMV